MNKLTVTKAIQLEEARKGITENHKILIADASVISGTPIDEIRNMDVQEAKKLIDSCSWIYPILQDQSESDKLKLGKKEYTILPLSKLKFSQFVDLEALIKNTGDSPYKAIPRLLAILTVNPELSDTKYEEEILRVENLIKQSELKEVVPVVNFTLKAVVNALEGSPIYSLREKTNLLTQRLTWMTNLETALMVKRKGLDTTILGMRPFVIWLKIRLLRLIRYLIIQSLKYSSSYNIK